MAAAAGAPPAHEGPAGGAAPALAELLQRLGHTKHLERERALAGLSAHLQHVAGNAEATAAVWPGLLRLIQDAEAWERRLGGLMGAKALIEATAPPCPPAPAGPATCGTTAGAPALADAASEQLVGACLGLLHDAEPRVRSAVGDALGVAARVAGPDVWLRARPQLLASIRDNYDRDGEGAAAEGPGSTASGPPAAGAGSFLGELLSSSYKPKVPGVGEMRHGTEGWRCLETSMRALVSVLDGAGHAVAPHITSDLVELVASSMHHPNRYVREAAHAGACALFRAVAGPPGAQASTAQAQGGDGAMGEDAGAQGSGGAGTAEGSGGADAAGSSGRWTLPALGLRLAPLISDGLTDNWSQVRYTGCVSARTLLLLHQQTGQSFEPLLPVLLPPMCLNRYYMAEGVRSYAQETWQLAMGGQGRTHVARHIQQVADYYVTQSKAVHHGVREAACACIAELAEKVDRGAVEPHMPRLLHCMLLCFKDMAWPVRDAACVACGRCARCYPEVCRPRLPELLDLWRAHLWDNVQSVRENSAMALADAMRGYPDAEPLATVKEAISAFLLKASEQPPDGERGRQQDSARSRSASHAAASPQHGQQASPQAGSSPGRGATGSRPRNFGHPRTASPSAGRPLSPARVAEQALKADPQFFFSEEDAALFGPGAAARFNTAFYIKGDGCMDFGFSREQEPWEASDGAVFMVRELAGVHPDACLPYLASLVELVGVAAHNNFDGAPKLRETVWKCLPAIAKAIGKQNLKRHLLEGLLCPLMSDLECSTQLTEAAAGAAVGMLRDLLGPSIFAARLTPTQVAAMNSSPHVPRPAMRVPHPSPPLGSWPQQTSLALPAGPAGPLGPNLGLPQLARTAQS